MKVGRPMKFETADELEAKIDEYFAGGYRKKTIRIGNKRDGYKEIEVPCITFTDLVLFLGFADRQSFYDYEKRSEFSCTMKKARTFIEREYEEQLMINPTGAIFALKNFGWRDKQEIDHTTAGESLNDAPNQTAIEKAKAEILSNLNKDK